MSDSAPPLLTLRLFGPFEVRVNGAPLPGLRRRQARWLLALLTLRAGHEVERAWLAPGDRPPLRASRPPPLARGHPSRGA